METALRSVVLEIVRATKAAEQQQQPGGGTAANGGSNSSRSNSISTAVRQRLRQLVAERERGAVARANDAAQRRLEERERQFEKELQVRRRGSITT